MNDNNEVLTLSALILGAGILLIISVFSLFSDQESVSKTTATSVATAGAEPKEDINARVASLADPQKAEVLQGHELFVSNCEQCHAINDKIVGPALKGVHTRWATETELINFIRYPQKVIDGGDEYAQKLYQEYGQYMPNHDFFSEEQVASILKYIKFESGEEIAMK